MYWKGEGGTLDENIWGDYDDHQMAAGDARAQAALAQGQAWGNVGGAVSYLGGMGAQGYGPFAKSLTAPPQLTATYNPFAGGSGTGMVPLTTAQVFPGT